MNLLEKETRGRQRGEDQHEEVQTRERDQGHGQLPQVAVQLTTETQAAGDPGNHGGHQVVQLTEGGGGQLRCAEADVVQGLVVDALDLT